MKQLNAPTQKKPLGTGFKVFLILALVAIVGLLTFWAGLEQGSRALRPVTNKTNEVTVQVTNIVTATKEVLHTNVVTVLQTNYVAAVLEAAPQVAATPEPQPQVEIPQPRKLKDISQWVSEIDPTSVDAKVLRLAMKPPGSGETKPAIGTVIQQDGFYVLPSQGKENEVTCLYVTPPPYALMGQNVNVCFCKGYPIESGPSNCSHLRECPVMDRGLPKAFAAVSAAMNAQKQ